MGIGLGLEGWLVRERSKISWLMPRLPGLIVTLCRYCAMKTESCGLSATAWMHGLTLLVLARRLFALSLCWRGSFSEPFASRRGGWLIAPLGSGCSQGEHGDDHCD